MYLLITFWNDYAYSEESKSENQKTENKETQEGASRQPAAAGEPFYFNNNEQPKDQNYRLNLCNTANPPPYCYNRELPGDSHD